MQQIYHSLKTSIWVTHLWEWFLSLATRAVQPVLFITVMYSILGTYPGWVSPGMQIDLVMFLALNGALDVASFGLPRLADQVGKEGNIRGAKQARALGSHLFWIMVANLIWGGIDHIFPTIPASYKTGIALAFVIVRAFYAMRYSVVIHALKREEKSDNYGNKLGIGVQHIPNEIVSLFEQTIAQKMNDLQTSLAVQIEQNSSPINYTELALALAPILLPMSNDMKDEEDEQCSFDEQFEEQTTAPIIAPIDLESVRITRVLNEQEDEQSHEPRNTDDLTPAMSKKGALSGDNDVLKKVRRLVRKNPHITAHELAGKVNISRSYAGKLKTQVLTERAS